MQKKKIILIKLASFVRRNIKKKYLFRNFNIVLHSGPGTQAIWVEKIWYGKFGRKFIKFLIFSFELLLAVGEKLNS